MRLLKQNKKNIAMILTLKATEKNTSILPYWKNFSQEKVVRRFVLLLIVLTSQLVNIALAQTTDEYGFIYYQMNSSTITFNCIEDSKMGWINYSNSIYNEEKIREEFSLCEVLVPYQSYGYRVDVDNKFTDAFVNTFGNEKMEMLSKEKEPIVVAFYLDHNNSVLMIYYTINKNSAITPDELASLEKNLLELIRFKVEWCTEKPWFDIVSIKTDFQEIASGKIKRIINRNKFVDKELERLERAKILQDKVGDGMQPIDKDILDEIKNELIKQD